MYELLSGELPYSDPVIPKVVLRILHDPAPSMLRKGAAIPPEVDAIVLRCLEKAPADRFSSVTELALALQAGLMNTRFGSRLRAAVDDARVARGLGIPVGTVFAITFAVGSGLAGLGGALGVEILGLDPNFPLRFMIYFLIVVTVGGTSGITGPFVASLLLGVADVAGKYYVPALGAFIVYLVMIAVLVLRPHGLFARPR